MVVEIRFSVSSLLFLLFRVRASTWDGRSDLHDGKCNHASSTLVLLMSKRFYSAVAVKE
jgi:hypothetical protein